MECTRLIISCFEIDQNLGNNLELFHMKILSINCFDNTNQIGQVIE